MMPRATAPHGLYPPITHRERVLARFRMRGSFGLTDEELGEWIALPSNSIRPTRCKLTNQGLIVDSGRKRETRSGRLARVWVLADRQTAARSEPLEVDAEPAPVIRLVLPEQKPVELQGGQLLFPWAVSAKGPRGGGECNGE